MNIDSTANIHPTAIIEDGAIVGADCIIGAYAIVGPDVVLGARVELKSHAVIAGWTTLGDDCEVYPFASVGHAPQDLKFAGERTKLEIGANTRIREGVTLNPGTAGGGGITKIGDNNLFMANAHVGHDCVLGNGNILANNVGLGGHVVVGDNIVMGALSAVHQFCRIGSGAMLAGFAAVTEDVIPFGMVHGNRANLEGLNLVGLKRRGYDKSDINTLREAFRDVFHEDADTLQMRLVKALADYPENKLVANMVAFAQADTKRGICTPQGR